MRSTTSRNITPKPPRRRQADLKAVEDAKKKIADAEKQLDDPKVKNRETIEARVKLLRLELSAAEAKVAHRTEMLADAPPVSLLKLPAAGDDKHGRVLFQEKGCMACHRNSGTEKNGEPFNNLKVPAMYSDAQFGPDLSRVALKLTPAGGADGARHWLVSWLLNPPGHSPRTKMPNVHLTTEEANDIAAWLLSQKPEWNDKVAVEPADHQTLQDMAKIYLDKVFTRSETRTILDNGITDDRLKSLAADADERELQAPLDDNKLKIYVGKKAIGNMGCYGCHSIPGFEKAKPIGTALNDWGKKDPARIAYEDSEKFVQQHFHIVSRRDDPKDKSLPAKEWHSVTNKNGQVLKPYEEYFADMLDHHHLTREGFLSLKLTEPRSYDYNRIKSWEDRLRMPQFKFSRAEPYPKKRASETMKVYYDRLRAELQRYGVSTPAVDEPEKEQTDELEAKLAPLDEARLLKEEAEGREAVMTFILGLVAEPVPPQFVHNPTGDKLAEVAGRKVLDKFNCAGCHIIRPGSIDFKPVDLKRFEGHPNVRKQEVPYTGDDYVYPEDIAWTGHQPTNPDKLTVHGVTPPIEVKFGEEDEPSKDAKIWLMQALHYHKDNQKDGKARDIPAGATLFIPPNWILSPDPNDPNKFTAPQLGGALHTPRRRVFAAKRSGEFRRAGEDEQCLRRRAAGADRRRPKSSAGMALQIPAQPAPDSAADRAAHAEIQHEPRRGAKARELLRGGRQDHECRHRPDLSLCANAREAGKLSPSKDSGIHRASRRRTRRRRKKELQSFWEQQLTAEKADADKKLTEAKERLNAAPAAAKADAQKQVDEAQKLADDLKAKASKKDVSQFVKQWEERRHTWRMPAAWSDI